MFNKTILLMALEIFLSQDHQTKNDWGLINDKHWAPISHQISFDESDGNCPVNMVEIDGLMKMDPIPGALSNKSIDALQKSACVHWLNKEPSYRDRCKTYDRAKWIYMSSVYNTKRMNYCIDKYEAGVRKGEYPMVMVNYDEAELICQSRGKRMCTEEEWTFSCEGPEAMPYPYGYTRDDTACVIDKTWRPYSGDLFPRNTIKAMKELDKLWQGEPAGSRPMCKSPFGVYDLTGNVDELTFASIPSAHKSVLKGGYWGGAVRNRCRAATRSHGPTFAFYQASFRCCMNKRRTND